MDTQTIEKLKQISTKKALIKRNTEKEERFYNTKEQELIRQLDLERDELLGDFYSNAH